MINQGIYEEIISKHLKGQLELIDRDDYKIKTEKMDVEEAKKILSLYISEVTRQALFYIRDSRKIRDKERLFKQIDICNQIISKLSELLDDKEFNSLQIDEEGEVLTSIYSNINSVKSINKGKVIRPVTSIAESSLFTGSRSEPDMLSELKKEILSANEINFLVSFIKWSDIRIIINELEEFTNNGGKLRLITTSYMEATDYKAIMELSKLKNTEIRVSYDVKRTRLHAKAYMFKRNTGFTTAYIGSSNLSNPALTSGLEWNLKVTEKDSFDIIQKFEATFESYWNDEEFKLFNPELDSDKEKLEQALKKKNLRESEEFHFKFDIRPYHYQKEILENLESEREVFDRRKNLIVAATGERVIIVTGCINALVSRVSGTFIKNKSCIA